MRKPKLKPTNGNIETLAAQAKLKRQTQCSEAINKILVEHKCELRIFVQIGECAVLLDQVVNLPISVNVVAKDIT